MKNTQAAGIKGSAGVQPKSVEMRVPIDEIRRRANLVAEFARRCAERTESERRVSEETIQMIDELELFQLLKPARFGGFEYSYVDLIDIVAQISRACASTAWCYSLGAMHQWLVAIFPDEAQREVWEGSSRRNLACGSYAPSAKARRDNGGFRVKGVWGFASNCDNSNWAILGALVPTEEGDGVLPGLLLIPRAQWRIDDNWRTAGLLGTGSKNIVIDEEVFVPAHRVLLFSQALSYAPPGAAANSNSIYRIPFLSVVPAAIAAPALGIAQGAVDEFCKVMGSRTTKGGIAGGGMSPRDFQAVQLRVAEAAALAEAATQLLRLSIGDAEDTVRNGAEMPIGQRVRLRRNHAYSVKLCCKSVDLLYEAAGGAGLFLSNGIQRSWRDVHAASKHIALNWDVAGTMYGKHELGLEPQAYY